MLTIAGGVILGVIGLWVILAIAGVILSSLEEIAAGCIVIIGFLAIIGVFVWLDSEWPEIDWFRTALAGMGLLFSAFIAFIAILDFPVLKKTKLFKKIRSYFKVNVDEGRIILMRDAYEKILLSINERDRKKLKFFKDEAKLIYVDQKYIVSEKREFSLYENMNGYCIKSADKKITEYKSIDEAQNKMIFIINILLSE
jgi:hypothetical protein